MQKYCVPVYIVYLGRKDLLRTEDEYCKHTRSKGLLSPRYTPYFLSHVLIFGVFDLSLNKKFIKKHAFTNL